MGNIRVVDVKQGVFALNDEVALENRAKLKENKTFMINLMASPGAGKTTTVIKTIEYLKEEYKIAVLEADIDSVVDAQKIDEIGITSLQVHTGGECAMDAEMTKQALSEINVKGFDLLILENVGNLVCPAETDVGASKNVCILSYPEGDDKPLKYPLMFEVSDIILVNKIDTKEYFKFDETAFAERVHMLNPNAKIFFISAKTEEGFSKWCDYLKDCVKEWND